MFFTADWKTKVRQDSYPLGPTPIALGPATTDASGDFSLTPSPLGAGRYWLLAEYAGDATSWPAHLRTEMTLP